MNTLKAEFRLNGLPYTLIKRNEVVALYGIGGDFTDELLHWEVDVGTNGQNDHPETGAKRPPPGRSKL